MASIIETHPQRQKIIDAILAGKTVRQIASSVTPHVSYVAVQRYRAKVVAPAMANAATLSKVLHGQGINPVETLTAPDVQSVTREALAADPILSRISRHQATVDDVLKSAADAKDARGVASLVSTDLKGLELQARLTGRLDAQPAGAAVAVVVPVNLEVHIRPATGVDDQIVDISVAQSD